MQQRPVSVFFAVSSHRIYSLMLASDTELPKMARHYRKIGNLITAYRLFELCSQEKAALRAIPYGNKKFIFQPHNQEQAHTLDILIKKVTSATTTSQQLAALGEIGAATIFTDRVDTRKEALELLSYIHDYTPLTQSSDEFQAIAKIKQEALIQMIHAHIQLLNGGIQTFAQNCFMINSTSKNPLQESEYSFDFFPKITVPFHPFIFKIRDLCEIAHNIPHGKPDNYRTISHALNYLYRQVIDNLNSSDDFLRACSYLTLGTWYINNKTTAVPPYYSVMQPKESSLHRHGMHQTTLKRGFEYLQKGIKITSACAANAPRLTPPRLKELVILHLDLFELLTTVSKEDLIHAEDAENYVLLKDKTQYLINNFAERFTDDESILLKYDTMIKTLERLNATAPKLKETTLELRPSCSNTICDFLKNDESPDVSLHQRSTHLTRKRKNCSTVSHTASPHRDKIQKNDPYPHLASYILM